jgi:hypothetical protein
VLPAGLGRWCLLLKSNDWSGRVEDKRIWSLIPESHSKTSRSCYCSQFNLIVFLSIDALMTYLDSNAEAKERTLPGMHYTLSRLRAEIACFPFLRFRF